MMKSLIAALIALSLICPGRADAQAQPDPEAVAAATELIITLRMPDQFRLTVPRMLQAMKGAVLQTRPKMERQFDAATPVVIEAMNARVYGVAGSDCRHLCAKFHRQRNAPVGGLLSHAGGVRSSWISRPL